MQKIDRITIELTHRCNLLCKFCYIKESNYFKKMETDINQIKRFISQFKEKKHFYITGGEPLISSHFIELLRYIKSLGHIAGFNTNGIYLNSKKANEISLINPEYVIFSVFGDKKTYTSLARTCKKNFSILYQNIKYFNSVKSKNTETIISCVITPENVNKIKEIYNFTEKTESDRLLLEHLQFYYDSEIENYDIKKFGHLIMKKSKKFNFSYKEFIKQIGFIINNKHGPKIDLRPAVPLNELKKYYSEFNKKDKIKCSNINSIIVEPDGDIRLCMLYAKKIGNISEFNISTINKAKKNLLKKLPYPCFRCCHRFKIANLKQKN